MEPCVRCGKPGFVRHLEKPLGMMCLDHAVELGNPDAIMVRAQLRTMKFVEDILFTEVQELETTA